MRSLLVSAAVVLFAACASTPAPAPPAVAAEPGRVYEFSEVSVKPQLINRATVARALEQNYSGALRDAGAKGTVHLRSVVGTDGQTSSIVVTRTTNSQFNAPAIAVMRVMRFSPATVGGVAVPVRIDLPVTFGPTP